MANAPKFDEKVWNEKSRIDYAPETRGYYALGIIEVIYIGTNPPALCRTTVRERLRSHFTGRDGMRVSMHLANLNSWDAMRIWSFDTNRPCIEEKRLINEYKILHNGRMPEFNELRVWSAKKCPTCSSIPPTPMAPHLTTWTWKRVPQSEASTDGVCVYETLDQRRLSNKKGIYAIGRIVLFESELTDNIKKSMQEHLEGLPGAIVRCWWREAPQDVPLKQMLNRMQSLRGSRRSLNNSASSLSSEKSGRRLNAIQKQSNSTTEKKEHEQRPRPVRYLSATAASRTQSESVPSQTQKAAVCGRTQSTSVSNRAPSESVSDQTQLNTSESSRTQSDSVFGKPKSTSVPDVAHIGIVSNQRQPASVSGHKQSTTVVNQKEIDFDQTHDGSGADQTQIASVSGQTVPPSDKIKNVPVPSRSQSASVSSRKQKAPITVQRQNPSISGRTPSPSISDQTQSGSVSNQFVSMLNPAQNSSASHGLQIGSVSSRTHNSSVSSRKSSPASNRSQSASVSGRTETRVASSRPQSGSFRVGIATVSGSHRSLDKLPEKTTIKDIAKTKPEAIDTGKRKNKKGEVVYHYKSSNKVERVDISEVKLRDRKTQKHDNRKSERKPSQKGKGKNSAIRENEQDYRKAVGVNKKKDHYTTDCVIS